MDYLVVFLVLVVFLQTRITDLRRAVICMASQSLIIACACFWLGLSYSSGFHAFVPGLLTLAVKVIFIPGAVLHLDFWLCAAGNGDGPCSGSYLQP